VPQSLRLRELTAEEERAISRLARSRTAPVRVVERARIVDLTAPGWRAGHRPPSSGGMNIPDGPSSHRDGCRYLTWASSASNCCSRNSSMSSSTSSGICSSR
jgi:hypothetical protein